MEVKKLKVTMKLGSHLLLALILPYAAYCVIHLACDRAILLIIADAEDQLNTPPPSCEADGHLLWNRWPTSAPLVFRLS